MKQYDVVVIGGGPGGYVAAIRASQLGMKTALVERDKLGGVCLNWGCIPTKSLIRNAEVISLLGEGEKYGFAFDRSTLRVDYAAAQKRSREVSARLVKGIEFLMKKNGVDVFPGVGKLAEANQVHIHPSGERIQGRNIIIATGARARILPGMEADGERILTARQALELTKVPAKVLIVGAGAIGLEFASVWRAYGTDITLIEMLPAPLPQEDADISAEVAKQCNKRGIKILTNAKVERVIPSQSSVSVLVKTDNLQTIECDSILISAGVTPNTDGLGLESVGIAVQRGYIEVDAAMRTSLPGVYAIGDVTGKLPLAHVASAQALIAVDTIAGQQASPLLYHNMPRCTYGNPETASVGLTEQQTREAGYRVKTGVFPFQANGKAVALGEPAGFVKIVADETHGEILGVHMVGPHVTELIAAPTGLLSLEATVDELSRIVHPHPTLSEVLMEAAHAVVGHAVHI